MEICCNQCIHKEVCRYKKSFKKLYKKEIKYLELPVQYVYTCTLFKPENEEILEAKPVEIQRTIPEAQIELPAAEKVGNRYLSEWNITKGHPENVPETDFYYEDGDFYFLTGYLDKNLKTISIPRNKDHYSLKGDNSLVINFTKEYTKAVYNKAKKKFELS